MSVFIIIITFIVLYLTQADEGDKRACSIQYIDLRKQICKYQFLCKQLTSYADRGTRVIFGYTVKQT